MTETRRLPQDLPGRRGEILEAALEVFSTRGYDAGSMREIAATVGVSEPALYRHFESKEALFLELIDVSAGQLRREAFGLMSAIEPDRLSAQMTAAFADRREAISRYGPVLRTIIAAVSHNPSFLKAYREMLVDPTRRELTETVERLDVQMGVSFTAEETAARVRALMALFVGYFLTSMVIDDEADGPIAEAVIRMMGWSR